MSLKFKSNLKTYDEASNLLFTCYCADKQAVRRSILHDNSFMHTIAFIEYRGTRFTMSEVYSKFPIGFLVKPQPERADLNG